MKAVILAGGFGTRISEETGTKPKPMVEIGGRPILWHIMKIYSAQGVSDFIVCLGYKGYVIKEYFANYFLHMSNVMFDMENNQMTVLHKAAEPWRVTLIDTGDTSHTGARIKRAAPYIDEETFCLTYGDGVGDVDVRSSIETHKRHGSLATVTAVRPPGRFGNLSFEGYKVAQFQEKPEGDSGWINGGFFVLEPGVIDYIGDEDGVVWEREPMEKLASDGELGGYFHEGFWQPMDTLRDKHFLEELWARGEAPWKIWD